jgi:hypothetical protein
MSTYLHPIGTDVLSIGIDTQHNWTTNISLFDVSNFAHPTLSQNLPLAAAGGWSWSEATWNHKAFQYWAPAKLLAIPSSNYEYTNGNYRYLSKLELITVDPAAGTLALKGEIDHSGYYNAEQSYWSYVDIRRSIFMGDYVYAISDKAITVHRTSDLGQVNVQTLPGYKDGDWYWWW